MKDLWPKKECFTKKEWWLLIGVSFLLIVLSSIPLVYAWTFAFRHGLFFKGYTVTNYEDFVVYLSYLNQTASGNWLFSNNFTTEPLRPWFSPFWFVIGKLGSWLGLSSLATFYFFRFLLIPPFVFVSYSFVSKFLKHQWRALALMFFLFASGFGFLFMLFVKTSDSKITSVDLWMAQAFPISSIFYSPHFTASWILFLLTMMFLLESIIRNRYRSALFAGVTGFLLFSFHPYHAPTIYAVFGVWLVYFLIIRKLTRRHVLSALSFFVLSVPTVGYWYFVTHRDELALSWSNNNNCPRPDLFYFFLGYGFFFFLWILGWYKWRKTENSNLAFFLVLWAAVQFFIPFLPFTFQQQLTEGIWFPMMILSTPAIFWFLSWLKEKMNGYLNLPRICFITILGVFMFSGTIVNTVRPLKIYSDNVATFFFTPAVKDALEWTKENTPDSAVFMTGWAFSSQNLVAWSNRRVYSGHWAETLNLREKFLNEHKFFNSFSEAERREFVCREGIDYLWCGPGQVGQIVCPEQPEFVKVFDNNEISIRKVVGCEP